MTLASEQDSGRAPRRPSAEPLSRELRAVPCLQHDAMRRPRRNHSPVFKAKVAVRLRMTDAPLGVGLKL